MTNARFWGIAVALVSTLSAAESRRPIRFDDLVALGRVADPQVSPDGAWVAYTVTRYSKEKNSGDSDTPAIRHDSLHLRLSLLRVTLRRGTYVLSAWRWRPKACKKSMAAATPRRLSLLTRRRRSPKRLTG